MRDIAIRSSGLHVDGELYGPIASNSDQYTEHLITPHLLGSFTDPKFALFPRLNVSLQPREV
jgi:hypothetical protein